MLESLFDNALLCIDETDVDKKISLTNAVFQKWQDEQLSLEELNPNINRISIPGRPQKPKLVAPKELPRRRLGSPQGVAALIHSICHIEFNAINLAWDAVYRFRDMPREYYSDWVNVAKEEAYHFSLLHEVLQEKGFVYGDFPAHNGLWEMAVDTDFDPLVRMALVPRVLEARGLDVTPGIIDKLSGIGENNAVAVLQIIHRDEIGHVEVGSRWFRYLCDKRGYDYQQMFKTLLVKYLKNGLKKPLARDTRLKAGFTEEELNFLEQNI